MEFPEFLPISPIITDILDLYQKIKDDITKLPAFLPISPITTDLLNLTTAIKSFGLTRLFTFNIDGSTTVFYTPINPQTNKIPTDIMQKFIKKDYKVGNKTIPIYYSPNLHLYYLKNPSKLPILITNYGLVLDYKYYGEEEPPDRPIEEQINDWKHGYMWGRVKLPNSTYTEEYLSEIEKKANIKIKRGWYWVKYHARLIELPSELLNINKGLLVLYYQRPNINIPLADTLTDYLSKENLRKRLQYVESIINTLGFKIYNDKYEYNGKTYQGVVILVSQDKNYYEVILPIEKTITGQYIQLVVAAIIILTLIVAGAFAAGFYMWSKAKIIDAQARKEYEENVRIMLDNLSPNDIKEIVKDNPDLLVGYGVLQEELNKDPSGSSILEYVKWGAIAIIGLIGGILLLKLIKEVED